MKKLITILIFSGLIGCAENNNVETCMIDNQDLGTEISCGSDTTFIPNQETIAIHDPCGDTPNRVDEVIIELASGDFLAWFRNIGLVTLNEGTTYTTTDYQRCSFTLDDLRSL